MLPSALPAPSKPVSSRLAVGTETERSISAPLTSSFLPTLDPLARAIISVQNSSSEMLPLWSASYSAMICFSAPCPHEHFFRS